MEIEMINRQHVIQTFKEYTDRYDSSMMKIRLKIEHTYRVAGLCDRISDSLQLNKEDRDIAWLIGMLHDIARFEQVRIYDSYNDEQTVDHAQFAGDLLFKENMIWDYVDKTMANDFPAELVEKAIRYHNMYRLPEGLTKRELMFCNIIRDADKVDILKANTDFPLYEIYNVPKTELVNGTITPAVLQAFDEGHAVLRGLKRSAVDNLVGHVSLTYELVFDESVAALDEYGYLDRILEFVSLNPETNKNLDHIREVIGAYIDKRLGRY